MSSDPGLWLAERKAEQFVAERPELVPALSIPSR